MIIITKLISCIFQIQASKPFIYLFIYFYSPKHQWACWHEHGLKDETNDEMYEISDTCFLDKLIS